MEQLRACGIIETIKISASGFPSRCSYFEFYSRYWMLLSKKQLCRNEPVTMCQYILQQSINVQLISSVYSMLLLYMYVNL